MATISETLATAMEHHRAGRLQDAENAYRQVLQIEPEHADAWHLLGVVASQAGNHTEAVNCITRALKTNPTAAEYHSNLGLAYRGMQRLDEAVGCQRRALELKPNFGEAHYRLGMVLQMQGKELDEAVSCYRRAVALKPDNVEAYNSLGSALSDRGDLEEAVTCYRKALELKPNHAGARNNLGVALKAQGKLAEAIVAFRLTLTHMPDLPEVHNNLGSALDEQGNLVEAEACYRRALQIRPKYAAAYHGLGAVLQKQEKLDEAVACYRQALAINPGFTKATNNLAIALKNQAKLKEPVVSGFSEGKPKTENCLLITAADAKFFDLVQGCIKSVRDKPEGRKVPFAFLDLGCTDEQITWLRGMVDFVIQPDWEFSFPNRENAPTYLKGLLARPFLQKYFPGYEVYLWIDADAWVQDWRAVELFLLGAHQRRGLAIVPELHRGSVLQYGRLPDWYTRIESWYTASFGETVGKKFSSHPLLNAGIFALHREAPHWKVWAETLGQGLQRNLSLLTDQMALNLVVYGHGLFKDTELLPSWCNWTCHFGLPVWDDDNGRFVEPYLPHIPLGIMHLTARKFEQVRMATTKRKMMDVCVRYPANPSQAAPTAQTPTAAPANSASSNERDYVSPGLLSVRPDRFFPNMSIGNKLLCSWKYLRREIPHNWYVDRRGPTVGFLNRDEASIVYNTALQFRGQPALEIGCWMGWSACHLSLAGVLLDVIDPMLERPTFLASVKDSLSAAGTMPSVNLVAGTSPEKVHQLAAKNQRPWSLLFIDGDHEGQAPLEDSIACEPYAAPDAAVLFHDLAAPAVAKGLDYFQEKGWHTLVYQTMQIMGVAWRGAVQPVEHFPDPSISWPMPAHLQRHPVSGWHKDVNPARQQKEFADIFAAVRPFTLLSESRLTSLYNLAMYVCLNDLPGNFVECGTWRGGATGLLAYVIKHHSRRPRRLFCFDTFEGMPDPTEADTHQGIPANDTPCGAGTLKAPIAKFLDVITTRLDVRDVVTPVQGLFQDTLPRTRDEIGPIALLHADGDWYTLTMDIFNNLFDQIVPGGFVQIDDYGHWEGCKKAVHDFEQNRGLSFAVHSIDYTGVWLRKT